MFQRTLPGGFGGRVGSDRLGECTRLASKLLLCRLTKQVIALGAKKYNTNIRTVEDGLKSDVLRKARENVVKMDLLF